MAINSVSTSHNAAAHAHAQPAKKSNVNFSDLMNAGMAAQPQAVTPAQATGTASTSTSTATTSKI
ncbi:hypothetical protein J8I26_18760 [Herbaspirillum sp. LeCh32-8]|uniref:hypothetical protein n=1 Tax=Herbaspirillum sp. LeCh32-8 TaxID=2821356 RepID=UPI001AE76E4B|nr:hypothetical protein [Herbaspirillum sp. LeCh32-8]MBP0600158.1 hypothetical protein [Herbaspirillum sp. LeCh32-8]